MSKTDLSIFHYDMNEEAFRAALAARCAAHPDLPVLRTIAAVGAYHADFGGTDVDSDRLTKGLIYMAQSGILISPDFEVDKVNFLYERNYLTETKPADLVFVSYIRHFEFYGRAIMNHYYDQGKMKSIREEMKQAADPAYYLDSKLGGILHNNNSPENWMRRAALGGAKMIYTHGGKDEIGTHTYRAKYAELIATSPFDKPASAHLQTVRDVHGQDLDIPLAWSGFCADKAYLQAVAPALAGSGTDLAKRAKTICALSASFSVDRPAPYSL